MLTQEFDANRLPSLTESEAAERLVREGFNELPSGQKRGLLAVVVEVVKEPMFLLLIAGGGIYLLLGDVREALMLLGFVFVVMGITLYQERKTERALEALRDLSSPRALVVRDGRQRRIPGREVVRGDILVLSEGDRVPADAVILSCVNLSVDEALLTGESVPVRKACAEDGFEACRPGGDDLPGVFSGTLVVRGFGIAKVTKTGGSTEIGKIGKALESISGEETLLQKETSGLVRRLAFAGLSLCIVVVVAYGLTRENWLGGFLAGITLAMAVLPEEFPVVLTIFLALGAWRISRKRVLTRRIPAVETLGSASVLCVDKTGTLTQNRMSVCRLFSRGMMFDVERYPETLPENLHELLEFGILAGRKDPFDPMEKALREFGTRMLSNTEHLHDGWTLVQEYPLSQKLLAMSRVWKSSDNDRYLIAAKGSPEAIADICHLDRTEQERLQEAINTMAGEGLRVIGVAKAIFTASSLPGDQHDFSFVFLGLVGFHDPLRPEVPPAIRECEAAGMRVVMITGDYPLTARKIASEAGLRGLDEIITGAELERMDPEELRRRSATTNIFARVAPEQKLLIVEAFKANGEVV
ncbi:MAG TPA: HAD-IC family P-type ATPase, partial [Thermodesulfovibrionales bacterium]|nr:HAD-IC family P-type ATPase [Thermodesulfovibrionales bacterium]